MVDIVELMRTGRVCDDKCRVMEAKSGCLCAEAADEIERLRAALRCSGGKVSQMSERMTEAEFNELTVRRVNRDGTAERLCSKAHAEITRLRADLAARDAEVARLREEVEQLTIEAKAQYSDGAHDGFERATDHAGNEIERLRAALEKICDGPRDADLDYLDLFVEVKMEARAALEGK